MLKPPTLRLHEQAVSYITKHGGESATIAVTNSKLADSYILATSADVLSKHLTHDLVQQGNAPDFFSRPSNHNAQASVDHVYYVGRMVYNISPNPKDALQYAFRCKKDSSSLNNATRKSPPTARLLINSRSRITLTCFTFSPSPSSSPH